MIDAIPPLEQESMRFGNKAFRSWVTALKTVAMLTKPVVVVVVVVDIYS
jgi:hypothetical protein